MGDCSRKTERDFVSGDHEPYNSEVLSLQKIKTSMATRGLLLKTSILHEISKNKHSFERLIAAAIILKKNSMKKLFFRFSSFFLLGQSQNEALFVFFVLSTRPISKRSTNRGAICVELRASLISGPPSLVLGVFLQSRNFNFCVERALKRP